MGTLFWFLFMLVLLVIEAVTVALVSVWFAAGAFVSFILSLFISNIAVEWIVFAVVSVICIIPLRPYFFKKVNSIKSKHEVGLETLIGETVKVEEDINNIEGTGRVYVKGQSWSAYTADGSLVNAGELVVIKEIKGVKLLVEKK